MREENTDSDAIEEELEHMHKESALKTLVTSDSEWKEYADLLLLASIRYMELVVDATRLYVRIVVLSSVANHK